VQQAAQGYKCAGKNLKQGQLLWMPVQHMDACAAQQTLLQDCMPTKIGPRHPQKIDSKRLETCFKQHTCTILCEHTPCVHGVCVHATCDILHCKTSGR